MKDLLLTISSKALIALCGFLHSISDAGWRLAMWVGDLAIRAGAARSDAWWDQHEKHIEQGE